MAPDMISDALEIPRIEETGPRVKPEGKGSPFGKGFWIEIAYPQDAGVSEHPSSGTPRPYHGGI